VHGVTIEEAYEKWAGELVDYATLLVNRNDAADVVAGAFAQLLERGPDLWNGVDDPRLYLFGAIANHARMHHRTTIRRAERAKRRAIADAAPQRVEQQPVDAGINDYVSMLEALSQQQRAVIFLSYWADLTPANIARVLDISEGAVRKQLSRARSKLREVLT
jgi:RNA polymerase sigma factor (sigma-70 family)